MEKKSFTDSKPTSSDFEQVLCYSIQHRNVIIKEMHQRLPRHWERPRDVSEQHFYENLIATLAEDAGELTAALAALRGRKSEGWTEVLDLPRRVLINGRRQLKLIDPQALDDLLSSQEGRSYRTLLTGLALALDKAGRPHFSRVVDWFLPLYPGFQDDATEPALVPVDGESFASSPNDRGAEWQTAIEQIQHALNDAAMQLFGQSSLDTIATALERLQWLAECHQGDLTQVFKAATVRLTSVIKQLSCCVKVEDGDVTSLLGGLIARLGAPEVGIDPNTLEMTVAEIECYAGRAFQASQRQHELKDAVMSALEQDQHDEAMRLAAERKDEDAARRAALQAIAATLRTLGHGRGGDSPVGTEVAPSPPPESSAVDRDVAQSSDGCTTRTDADDGLRCAGLLWRPWGARS